MAILDCVSFLLLLFAARSLAKENITRPVDCDFEIDLCSWVQLKDDKTDLIRHKGPTASEGTGPIGDRTTGDGFYLYLEASGDLRPFEKARIQSGPIEATNGSIQCFTFWYHMYTQGEIDAVGRLRVFTYTFPYSYDPKYPFGGDIVWSRVGDAGRYWIREEINIHMDTNYTIVLEAAKGTDFRSDIAIDDLQLTDGPCPEFPDVFKTSEEPENMTTTKEQIPDPTSESDTNATTEQMDANVTSTDNQSNVTTRKGPENETSTKDPITSTTISEEFDNVTASEMFTDVTTSNVPLIAKMATTREETEIATSTKEPTNGSVSIEYENVTTVSEQANATTNNDTTLFTTSIVTSTSEWDNITSSLDDLSSTVKTVIVPGPANCDFEVDLCSWVQLTDDKTDLIRHRGPTNSTGTGPAGDHTSGDGHYLYLEAANDLRPFDMARIQSGLIEASNGSKQCFTIWYHMYTAGGADAVGRLRMYTFREPKSESSGQIVWSRVGNAGALWFKKQVDIEMNENYTIVLEAAKGADFRSDIAIDDLVLTEGPCPEEITTPFPTTTDPITESHTSIQTGENYTPTSHEMTFKSTHDNKGPFTSTLSTSKGQFTRTHTARKGPFTSTHTVDKVPLPTQHSTTNNGPDTSPED